MVTLWLQSVTRDCSAEVLVPHHSYLFSLTEQIIQKGVREYFFLIFKLVVLLALAPWIVDILENNRKTISEWCRKPCWSSGLWRTLSLVYAQSTPCSLLLPIQVYRSFWCREICNHFCNQKWLHFWLQDFEVEISDLRSDSLLITLRIPAAYSMKRTSHITKSLSNHQVATLGSDYSLITNWLQSETKSWVQKVVS